MSAVSYGHETQIGHYHSIGYDFILIGVSKIGHRTHEPCIDVDEAIQRQAECMNRGYQECEILRIVGGRDTQPTIGKVTQEEW